MSISKIPTTVLYIDDEPLNLRLVKKMVEHAGFKFVSHVDVHKGLAEARKMIPDVIIMDINMPDLNGIQATQIVKADEQLHRVPVIALTADNSRDMHRLTIGNGCDAYLTKPIDRKTLLNTIRQFI